MYFDTWQKIQQHRGAIYSLHGSTYKVETLSLPDHIHNKLAKIWWLYEYMISPDHDPEESFLLLNEGYKEMYLEVFKYCKENGKKNLQRFLGRRYNMLYNIPMSFEVYQGRIYELSL